MAESGSQITISRFFQKRWTEWELDGLVSLQHVQDNQVIIPIWLDLGRDEILAHSPPLRDKVAVIGNRGVNSAVIEILIGITGYLGFQATCMA